MLKQFLHKCFMVLAYFEHFKYSRAFNAEKLSFVNYDCELRDPLDIYRVQNSKNETYSTLALSLSVEHRKTEFIDFYDTNTLKQVFVFEHEQATDVQKVEFALFVEKGKSRIVLCKTEVEIRYDVSGSISNECQNDISLVCRYLMERDFEEYDLNLGPESSPSAKLERAETVKTILLSISLGAFGLLMFVLLGSLVQVRQILGRTKLERHPSKTTTCTAVKMDTISKLKAIDENVKHQPKQPALSSPQKIKTPSSGRGKNRVFAKVVERIHVSPRRKVELNHSDKKTAFLSSAVYDKATSISNTTSNPLQTAGDIKLA